MCKKKCCYGVCKNMAAIPLIWVIVPQILWFCNCLHILLYITLLDHLFSFACEYIKLILFVNARSALHTREYKLLHATVCCSNSHLHWHIKYLLSLGILIESTTVHNYIYTWRLLLHPVMCMPNPITFSSCRPEHDMMLARLRDVSQVLK